MNLLQKFNTVVLMGKIFCDRKYDINNARHCLIGHMGKSIGCSYDHLHASFSPREQLVSKYGMLFAHAKEFELNNMNRRDSVPYKSGFPATIEFFSRRKKQTLQFLKEKLVAK